MSEVSTITKPQKQSLVAKMADRFGVEPEKMLSTLKATAFQQKEGSEVSNEQMMALLVVADQYGLNPWTKEIYAFPDKQNGIVPIVGIDGWSRIINSNPDFDGIVFTYSEEIVQNNEARDCPLWCECTIYRKDRDKPTVIREYLDEVYREPFRKNNYTVKGPWQTHTKRMLRWKTMIQAARIAFGYVGIYDQDEAERIFEGEYVDVNEAGETVASSTADLNSSIQQAAQKTAANENDEPQAEVSEFQTVIEMIDTAETLDDLDLVEDYVRNLSNKDKSTAKSMIINKRARLEEDN